MAYVDGFVLPLPKKNLAAYKVMAKKASKIWMDHGAVEYREAIGEDMSATFCMPMTKLSKCKPSETVVFAWIVYKSKKHRDAVNKKVMKDPRMNEMIAPGEKMPFDCKKMGYGGFEVIVEG